MRRDVTAGLRLGEPLCHTYRWYSYVSRGTRKDRRDALRLKSQIGAILRALSAAPFIDDFVEPFRQQWFYTAFGKSCIPKRCLRIRPGCAGESNYPGGFKAGTGSKMLKQFNACHSRHADVDKRNFGAKCVDYLKCRWPTESRAHLMSVQLE